MQIKAAHRIGAPVIELHSGAYADAWAEGDWQMRDYELRKITDMTAFATDLGLDVHVGHGLAYECVTPIAALPQVAELNIGHFLIGESIFRGLGPAIAEMRRLMDAARA